jgi:hypothetical protein
MDKRKLHHLWTEIRPLRPAYFAAAGAVSLMVGVVGLRANYIHMEDLRDKVYQADKNGGDVQGALTNLQRYVTAHMNTGLSKGSNAVYPPIQLKYTYERLQSQQLQSSNSAVYNDAQQYCEAQDSTDFSGRNRVPCIESYVQSHGVTQKQIPDAMYKFDFIAPLWSPDVAGYGLLSAAVFFVIAAAVWAIGRKLRS